MYYTRPYYRVGRVRELVTKLVTVYSKTRREGSVAVDTHYDENEEGEVWHYQVGCSQLYVIFVLCVMCAMGGRLIMFIVPMSRTSRMRGTRVPVRVAVLVCQSVFLNTKTSLLYFVLYGINIYYVLYGIL